MIRLTRACAASGDSLMVTATLQDAEIYQPDARIFQYEYRNPEGERWYFDDFALSVQRMVMIEDAEISPDRPRHYAFISAEGDTFHFARPDRVQEMIPGAGTANPGAKFYGKLHTLRQIGSQIYACGAGGQVYVRHGRDDWRMLTDAVLFDPETELHAIRKAPPMNDPGYADYVINLALNPPSRNILFNDMQGLSEDAIYLCGEVGPGTKPVLCFWDGETLEELKLPLAEAALTGIYIESPDSVWVCGREGVLLHGSRARGFNPVPGDRRLNLFHHITPYRGKLVMPASVRPGGLWEFDPKTGAFGRFDPPLPRLTRPPADSDEPHGGPFFAQATGDVLWVIAARDIYRFDGQSWERIQHPDMP